MKNSKFRAWDEQKKVMHYDFQFIKSGNDGNDWIVFTSDKHPLGIDPNPLNDPHFQQQLIIMEKVGVNDIFEGDIVDFGGLGVVKYNEDRFYVDSGSVQTRVSKNHKVIGNIYENPELLKNPF
jgi:hypothetical protein